MCPACGSLSECPHDRQGGTIDREEDSGAVPKSIDPTDTVDMVTVCSVPPGVEVFNTYGATLGNAALLARAQTFAKEHPDATVLIFSSARVIDSILDDPGR